MVYNNLNSYVVLFPQDRMALPASSVTMLVRPVRMWEKFGSHGLTSPVGLERLRPSALI